MFESGFSSRNFVRAAAPGGTVHILVGDRHEMWCSGAPGEVSTPTRYHKVCPKCLALLNDQDPEETADLKEELGFPWAG